MNSFNIFGRIIQEPEIVTTSSGVKMCKLRVSVNKTNAEKEGQFDILDVALFRKLADQEYSVGQFVAVNGKLTSNYYEKEGSSYNYINLIANNVEVIDA